MNSLTDLSGKKSKKQLQMSRKASKKRKKVAFTNSRSVTTKSVKNASSNRRPEWASAYDEHAKSVNRRAANRASKNAKNPITAEKLDLMELKRVRRNAIEECTKSRKKIDAKFKMLYKKYPALKPKEPAKPQSSGKRQIACSSSKYGHCESIVYMYGNGNKKIVTWERVEAPKSKKLGKSKGVADCGCAI